VDNRQVEEARAYGKTEGEKYGHAVKRHLDIFDLEASLGEVSLRRNNGRDINVLSSES